MSEADSIKQQIKTAESIEEILEIVDKVLDMKNEKIHELEEENCTPEYDDEECCFRLVYTSNYAERIESLDGLIPIEEGE